MNPRDADPLTIVEDQDRPLIWIEPQYATIRDRPGITIPLVLAAVAVVAVVLAVWGGTR